jgi:hypothetical protein
VAIGGSVRAPGTELGSVAMRWPVVAHRSGLLLATSRRGREQAHPSNLPAFAGALGGQARIAASD